MFRGSRFLSSFRRPAPYPWSSRIASFVLVQFIISAVIIHRCLSSFFFSYFSTLSPSGLRLADRASCSRHRRRLRAELVNLLALRLLVWSGLLYPAFWFLCAASHVHWFIHPSIALSPCIIHLSSPAFHLARPVHASHLHTD